MIPFSDQMFRWTQVAGRALNKFEQMSIARPFVYDHYWRRWSRIIKPVVQGHPWGFVEMNLTPAACVSTSTWNADVQPMRLRIHCTSASRDDKYERDLPTAVFEELANNVGYEQAAFMCNSDLFDLIDFDKLVVLSKHRSNGGVPLDFCRKAGTVGEAA